MGSNNQCRDAKLRQPGVLPVPKHLLQEAQLALERGRPDDAASILRSGISGLGNRLTSEAMQQIATLSGGKIS